MKYMSLDESSPFNLTVQRSAAGNRRPKAAAIHAAGQDGALRSPQSQPTLGFLLPAFAGMTH
jgi:hypothetical protein